MKEESWEKIENTLKESDRKQINEGTVDRIEVRDHEAPPTPRLAGVRQGVGALAWRGGSLWRKLFIKSHWTQPT